MELGIKKCTLTRLTDSSLRYINEYSSQIGHIGTSVDLCPESKLLNWEQGVFDMATVDRVQRFYSSILLQTRIGSIVAVGRGNFHKCTIFQYSRHSILFKTFPLNTLMWFLLAYEGMGVLSKHPEHAY